MLGAVSAAEASLSDTLDLNLWTQSQTLHGHCPLANLATLSFTALKSRDLFVS